jgi:threonine dehydrogenase-like Zn-dependent dehydrogenase
MKATCIPAPGTVRVLDFPDPSVIEPTDAVLRVTAAGICGTDLHRLDQPAAALDPGLVIGHEFVGVVEDVGSAVAGIVPGGRYLAAMYVVCGRCADCQRGQHPSCPSFAMFGSPSGATLQGGQAEYVRVPIAEMTLTPVPDSVTDEQILPVGDILATAYDGVRGGGPVPGIDVVVVGAGPVGQLVVECALLLGAARVFAIDVSPTRLIAAEHMGAVPLHTEGAVESLMELTSGRGGDLVVEAVGTAPAIETAFSVAARGAHVALVGVAGDAPLPISARELFVRRLNLRGVIGNPYRYRQELVQLVESGRLRPERVISHRIPLSDAADGYREFATKRANKVVLIP